MRPKLTDLTNSQAEDQTNAAEYHQAMMCTLLAGRGVIRVMERCTDAQENKNLGELQFTNKDIKHTWRMYIHMAMQLFQFLIQGKNVALVVKS